jgi:hypothetical protein
MPPATIPQNAAISQIIQVAHISFHAHSSSSICVHGPDLSPTEALQNKLDSQCMLSSTNRNRGKIRARLNPTECCWLIAVLRHRAKAKRVLVSPFMDHVATLVRHGATCHTVPLSTHREIVSTANYLAMPRHGACLAKLGAKLLKIGARSGLRVMSTRFCGRVTPSIRLLLPNKLKSLQKGYLVPYDI